MSKLAHKSRVNHARTAMCTDTWIRLVPMSHMHAWHVQIYGLCKTMWEAPGLYKTRSVDCMKCVVAWTVLFTMGYMHTCRSSREHRSGFLLQAELKALPNTMDNEIKFIGHRYENVHTINLDNLSVENIKYLVVINAKVNATN